MTPNTPDPTKMHGDERSTFANYKVLTWSNEKVKDKPVTESEREGGGDLVLLAMIGEIKEWYSN